MIKQIKPREYVYDFSEHIEKNKQKQPIGLSWYVLDFSNGGVNLFNVVPLIMRDLEWRKDLNIHNFDAFAKEMNHIVIYLFHGRSQFEQHITCSYPCVDKDEVERLVKARKESPDNYRYGVNLSWGEEMDIAFQILANWDAFISYMWKHREELIVEDEDE